MDTDTKNIYVNVYEITRCYGGPEEGGWWYDTGVTLISEEVSNMEEAYNRRLELLEDYPRTDRRYSVLGGDDYDILIEDTPGEDFPAYRPRYE